ncbi:MAG TPA: DUF1549 domain-containing protein, partial [Pirellulaceae bacterium]|nr:DUF1549 domain-containing protein [Pirellulaceae bacterium]
MSCRLLPLMIVMGRIALAGEPDFDKEVAPILAGRCLECHSGAEPKGKLDLSAAKAAFAGGESGAAIVGGRPEESYLWERVEADEMPPKHPLPANERAILKAWIAAGAKWGTDPIDRFRYTSAVRAGYDWWSLQSTVQPQPPAVKNARWVKNEIDRFVQATLEAQGLAPSPPVDRRTLIRRLYYDLIGLPPSVEQLDDQEPYGALVDKLLASSHYGERWARHWLDVAHFGESDGFEYDKMRPNAWRYRDWVIDALNRDLPYD